MSNEIYAAQLEELNAIPDEKLVEPTVPVANLLQEAEDLYEVALKDKDALINRGLNWNLVEDLNRRTELLRHAQGSWMKELDIRREVQQLWKEKSPEAYELRDNILQEFLFAYRNDESGLKQSRRVAEGTGAPDMIQDLVNLAYIGNSNQEPLKAINFDFSQLSRGVELAEEMANLLAKANGEKGEELDEKVLRDKAYGFVKEAVDEIRAFGKFVFRKDPERQERYTVAYYKK